MLRSQDFVFGTEQLSIRDKPLHFCESPSKSEIHVLSSKTAQI